MGIFGARQTPEGSAVLSAGKQLRDLKISFATGVVDPLSQTASLEVEVKTAFMDSTTGSGIPVTFFLSGNNIAEIVTDDFGIARLIQSFPASFFAASKNELTVRVRGFSNEASMRLFLDSKIITIKSVSHAWSVARKLCNESSCNNCWLFSELRVHLRAACYTAPFSLEGICILFQERNRDEEWITCESRLLDATGQCEFWLNDYYCNTTGNPNDGLWNHLNSREQVRFWPKGWPDSAVTGVTVYSEWGAKTNTTNA